ncbi:MAG: hypothetical protein JWQ90_2330 [Hydrocarboniphaga sp.]|uniref:alpha-2-macroglobulin family protein n=1 Tax=Hydrocarboniphaga sp. TaxID=2033016 RepID=UPI002629EE73|nr:alpha-2-macroglobulin [Hydrocarboniphaga sp.]MDB5969880.1 hypothetical protein [Hydrocarboniphaga sp.]
MKFWKSLRTQVVRGSLQVWAALGWLGHRLFGQVSWQAPGWLTALKRGIAWLAATVMVAIRRSPRIAAAVAVLVVLIAAGSYGGWRWWQSRPKPVEVSVYAPELLPRTCYECGSDAKPAELTVSFSESVAPLELDGKILDPAKAGINVGGSKLPSGTWSWSNDRTLAFRPAEDWPIDAEYDVEFARKGFVARHVHLERYEFKVRTAPFQMSVANKEFYQHPVVASDKKAVFTLNFSHPVDVADFESRLKLQLFERIDAEQEQDAGAVAYTVSYDNLKLNAYVHSAQLTVPEKQGRLELSVAKGVHAARGGNKLDAPLTAEVVVPGINSLRVNDVSLVIARDERNDPRQLLLAAMSYSVLETDMAPKIKTWLLPPRHPDAEKQKAFEASHPGGGPFDWNNCECIGGSTSSSGLDQRIIDQSQPLPLTLVPGELEHHELHSFSFTADPQRFVYVRIDKGLKSFGGFRLGDTVERVLQVPEYPRELRVMAEGSLMAMSGPKRLNLFSRDVPAMRVEIERLLPHQLQHLVTQTQGRFASPEFQNYRFDASNITEHLTQIENLPELPAGTANYSTLDLGRYLKSEGGERRGIFLLRLQAWDKKNNQPLSTESEAGSRRYRYNEEGEQIAVGDTRLIVITDLGLVVKRNLDGTQDVFVQSIHSGAPVAGAEVSVLGRNGEAVLTQTSDAEGHARFASLKDFTREQQPVLYLARKDGDSSFMPIDSRVRQLDLSRFDVGGVSNTTDADALTAYLFSDRGLYRPGEEIRIGAIIKSQDWKPLQGVPLQMEITDPRGTVVKKDKLVLGAGGFEEIRYSTQEASPAGNYTINVSITKGGVIGSLQVQVRDFLPDRMKMSAALSAVSTEGWVSPQDLKANITLQNLFGTPAQQRRVTASIRLSPGFPSFAAYRDYHFHDPQVARQSFDEELPDGSTDDDGSASFDLNLQRFEKATYQLQFVAQGFEADGGRGVAVQTTQLVSSMPYLVGYKSDGDLDFIGRNVGRAVSLIAIDPKAQKTSVKGLKLSLLKIVYTSVLVKQNNGTYRYESRRKELSQKESTLAIAAAGSKLPLQTSEPGSYAYLLRDDSGQQLARIDYQVAGDANLTRSLEKNAELQLALSKPDYAPGEEIELQITAPYAGAGLITIERDKVYAWHWFRAGTTASTQRIRLPEGIEGNAYVSVSFVRDPGSPEIYTSPLSYGVKPFSIALGARRNEVHLAIPDKLKPGETASFRYRTDRPSRIVVFAVDEGILQVARYQPPDPLAHFFQKRSLDVSTRQILDLILPEFRDAAMAAAPGGDGDNLLAKHLNPFKRKGDKPVAWWSGIVDADASERELRYTVPDYFNGTLRVFAVAVSDEAIGVFDGKSLVRGDFVLSPNAPTTVAPGDEFEVSVGVANNVGGSGKDAKVAVTLETTAGLKIVGDKSQTVAIPEAHESSARFRLKATEALGSADLVFVSRLGNKAAQRKIDLSVRPAVPYRVTLQAGSVAPSKRIEVSAARELYPQFRELEAGMSIFPLALAHGYTAYLQRYPYSCTEQLMSMAMPGIVLSQRPEFGYVKATPGSDLPALIDELRSRQNADGAYRYWPGSDGVQEFVSIYAQHGLIEAADLGLAVPRDLIEHGNEWLRTLASRDGDSLEDERNSAYALYLLTRQGQVMSAEAAGLRQRLEERYKDEGRGDIAVAYLAASLQLMKQTRDADKLIAQVAFEGAHPYDRWRDAMVWDAQLLFLTARHFPQRLAKLPPSMMDNLVKRTQQGLYHSLAAGTTLLALDAYARAAGESGINAKFAVTELLRDGKTQRALRLPDTLLPKVDFGSDAKALRFDNGAKLNAYTIVSQAGFERVVPNTPLVQGFEILHEYTNTQGVPVSTVKMGDEIDVHLKFRANERQTITDAALVDLLPGGFELVVQPQERQQAFLRASSSGASEEPTPSEYGEGDDEEDSGDGRSRWTRWVCPVCVNGTNAYPQYADFREDRVVFYTEVSTDIGQIVYRIKATNAGTYTLPPAYGESMYEPNVQARSAGGQIVVEKP